MGLVVLVVLLGVLAVGFIGGLAVGMGRDRDQD